MKKATARPIWTGSISFGLVTIPIKLFSAVREQRLHFRSLHDQDQVPLKQKLVCPADGKEVHPEHVVKGYEIEKDHFVIIQQEDLEAAMPKATKAIEIMDFVDLDAIDPLYFDRPYYVAPKPEGAKPYKLLLEAMEKTKKVGIATIVMYNKQYLAALRPVGDTLCLETMHFADEVVESSTVPDVHSRTKVDERELKVAQQLIDSLSTDFKPEKYKDEYRQRVMELIERKAKGDKIVARPAAEPTSRKATDLMAALEASLAKTKSAATATVARNPRRRKSA
jgi:DNA end-binding protein Ku